MLVLKGLGIVKSKKNCEHSSYEIKFKNRIICNNIASHVKLADLCDNMDILRIKNPTKKDYERIEKYRKAAERILFALEEEGHREIIIEKCRRILYRRR